jgi:hypothetical protein
MFAALNDRTATAAELVRLGADINTKDNVRGCPCARLRLGGCRHAD